MADANDWLRQALAAHRAGDLAAAALLYQNAIDESDSADAWHMLGMLRHQAGDAPSALEYLVKALRKRPNDPAILANRAAVNIALGAFTQAQEDAYRASRAQPDSYAAWFNLGLALEALSRWGEALDALERAQALRPGADLKATQQRCAFALARRYGLEGSPSAAKTVWGKYFAYGGEAAEAWLLSANVLSDLGEHEDSLRRYANARQRAPENADYASAELISHCHQPSNDAAAQAQMTQAWGQQFCAGIVSDVLPIRRSFPRRIGFYSPRFAAGPMVSLALPLLQRLRELGIELYLYAGFDYCDEDTPRFRALASAWRECTGHPDAALVLQARGDKLDVMVDLCGHAPGNRLRAFAQRLAPLQLSWGDWFATTGVPNMDVFFGDPVLTPETEDRCFSERVLQLPNTRFVYAPPPLSTDLVPSATQASPLRFASFNRLSKLSDVTLGCWARILNEVPHSLLHLRASALDEPATVAALKQRFALHGIAEKRIICSGFGSYASVMADYADVDIALDPFPFNGCVTTMDALWTGVPVVALLGQCLVARQGAALLTAHGLHDCVASTVDDYVRIAIALAASPTERIELRQRLLTARAYSVLFDVPRFANDWLAALSLAANG